MDRYEWFIAEVLKQFKAIEETLKALLAKIPHIGTFAADNSNLIALAVMVIITALVIKPLIKWSIGILIIGAIVAAAISHLSGMSFWGVLPLTALGTGVVLFSNKFMMG